MVVREAEKWVELMMSEVAIVMGAMAEATEVVVGAVE